MVANAESPRLVDVASAKLVSVNGLVSIVMDTTGIQLKREYDYQPRRYYGPDCEYYDPKLWETSMPLRQCFKKT
jgi:hypothetical protein